MRKLNNYTNNTKQALHPQNNSINAGAIRQSTEIRQYKDNVFCLYIGIRIICLTFIMD